MARSTSAMATRWGAASRRQARPMAAPPARHRESWANGTKRTSITPSAGPAAEGRPPLGIAAVDEAEKEHREADPIGVGELPGERARDGSAPDRVVLLEQEDEGRGGAQQGGRKAEAHEPERRVGEDRQQEHAERGSELEGHQPPGERSQGRHDQERQREVIEQQRVAHVGPRVPAMEPQRGQQVSIQPGRGRNMAGGVAPRRDRGQEEERGAEVVEKDEEDREEPEPVHERLPPLARFHRRESLTDLYERRDVGFDRMLRSPETPGRM